MPEYSRNLYPNHFPGYCICLDCGACLIDTDMKKVHDRFHDDLDELFWRVNNGSNQVSN